MEVAEQRKEARRMSSEYDLLLSRVFSGIICSLLDSVQVHLHSITEVKFCLDTYWKGFCSLSLDYSTQVVVYSCRSAMAFCVNAYYLVHFSLAGECFIVLNSDFVMLWQRTCGHCDLLMSSGHAVIQ